ncbi:MAG: LuxR C-terminal-related transcriptional regulator [Coxiellaceae bacterium]|nr:LuxR C-terminal-related transcriptional regulator [Coxiellaceae bacterium]
MTSPQFFNESHDRENTAASHWHDVLIEIGITKKIYRKKLPHKLYDNKLRYILDGEYAGKYLTERQRLVLIEFLKDKSAKAIALDLKISERTVEDYSKILREKFSCDTKRMLIKKLNAMGYLHKLNNLKSTHKKCTLRA